MNSQCNAIGQLGLWNPVKWALKTGTIFEIDVIKNFLTGKENGQTIREEKLDPKKTSVPCYVQGVVTKYRVRKSPAIEGLQKLQVS